MIAITGATGKLGQLVIEDLLKRQVSPTDIVAVARNREKAAALVARGVTVREANYQAPETLEKAFEGVDQVLLISGSEVGQRIQQHQNVITAAKTAQVKRIVYTSILNADTSKMKLAVEHVATESAIQASGIPFVFLRNGWYLENYTDQIPAYLQHGVAGSAKDGKLSAAARADFAAAAAAVLVTPDLQKSVYELGGHAFTLNELAIALSKASGKSVAYHDLPVEDYEKVLVSVGLPGPLAHVLAESDLGILRGDLFTESADLTQLIGRPVLTLDEAIQASLK